MNKTNDRSIFTQITNDLRISCPNTLKPLFLVRSLISGVCVYVRCVCVVCIQHGVFVCLEGQKGYDIKIKWKNVQKTPYPANKTENS